MGSFLYLMSWRILYVESSEKMQLHLDNVKVTYKDSEHLIPISDLHTIILDNYKIYLSVHLINALSKANVNVVLCGIDHLPKTIIHPISGHSLSPINFKNQLKWEDHNKTIVHKLIVKNKILNQIKVLEHFKVDSKITNHLLKFHDEVKAGDPGNREGLVSKMYFRHLFGEGFKRFAEDVVNAGLNYGYAILRSQISKTIVAKGLNPSLGIFHIGRDNLYNLSDDIIEVFRPIIDIWVKNNLLSEVLFTKEHRLALIQSTLQDVYIKNQKQTIFNAINIYVDSIISIFNENNYKYEMVSLVYE